VTANKKKLAGKKSIYVTHF